jgi:hypothetical protein
MDHGGAAVERAGARAASGDGAGRLQRVNGVSPASAAGFTVAPCVRASDRDELIKSRRWF